MVAKIQNRIITTTPTVQFPTITTIPLRSVSNMISIGILLLTFFVGIWLIYSMGDSDDRAAEFGFLAVVMAVFACVLLLGSWLWSANSEEYREQDPQEITRLARSQDEFGDIHWDLVAGGEILEFKNPEVKITPDDEPQEIIKTVCVSRGVDVYGLHWPMCKPTYTLYLHEDTYFPPPPEPQPAETTTAPAEEGDDGG
jgi:hypothetical protein